MIQKLVTAKMDEYNSQTELIIQTITEWGTNTPTC